MPMSQDDVAKYKALYVTTATENVKNLQKNVLLLKEQASAELIETMHRDSHSLKSESLLMGYTNVGRLAEAIEHLFRQKQEKNETLSPETVSLLEAAINHLAAALEEIEKNDKEPDLSEDLEKIEKEME